jgi:hypothetical protein
VHKSFVLGCDIFSHELEDMIIKICDRSKDSPSSTTLMFTTGPPHVALQVYVHREDCDADAETMMPNPSPPGTGKMRTSATIIYQLAQQGNG